MVMADVGPATTFLQSGRVKALAVTSTERLKDHPTVPTLQELGVDMKASTQDFYGTLARDGQSNAFRERMFDFEGLNGLLGTSAILARGKRYEEGGR